ncbi:hypothetical protein ABK905_13825 [Acerihabitans sp. KWT182]|uniref:MFS transporter n=1 Tax=Acerihabitans sp. KWT182 TaxID=3157919 RepID=A0AAU7Q4P8_9GAMM
MSLVSVALVLVTVDMTVLYIALPQLTRSLAATANAKLWIVNIYPLVVSGLLLGAGTFGDRFGHKTLFCWACRCLAWLRWRRPIVHRRNSLSRPGRCWARGRP